jgi:pimeloyl-ACP methyl ester carboxylesterase
MSTQAKPSIVFVHGIWADGSSFSKLIPTLQAEGHDVIAAQYGLDTLAGDVAAVKSTLARVSSPALLVGHSYGGTLITAAGTDPRVAGLIYIAALAPDADETSQSQVAKFPVTDVFSHIEVADGRIWMKPDGIGCFAGDLPEAEQKVVWAKLVHRSQQGPHRPTRAGTLHREAHGRHNRRVALQSRPDALPAACSAGRDPDSRKGRSEIQRSAATILRTLPWPRVTIGWESSVPNGLRNGTASLLGADCKLEC